MISQTIFTQKENANDCQFLNVTTKKFQKFAITI